MSVSSVLSWLMIHVIFFFKMALSLAATGYFIYLVEPWTPNAVVVSVIVFNAAFGYRYDLLPS